MNNRTIDLLAGLLLAGMYFYFAVTHMQVFFETKSAGYAIIVIVESIFAISYLLRRSAETLSTDRFDWFVAIVGSFYPFLYIPSLVMIQPAIGAILMAMGSVLAIPSILSLNRSIGIVPANRGVKTSGMYAVVRHPIYLSYVFIAAGYLLTSFSVYNLAVVAMGMTAMVFRIFGEEKHLLKAKEYRAYAKKVRWRMIPFVF